MVGARGLEPIQDPARHSATIPSQAAATTDGIPVGEGGEEEPGNVKTRQSAGQPATLEQSKGSQTEDPELTRLSALWPRLSSTDRSAILALATSLGVGRATTL